MSFQIHWHEGLFLQPHHLQQFQKNILDQFGTERRMSWAYPYGVIEARLSTDDLESHRLRFEKLHVVMPNGFHLMFPENAEVASLDIKDAFLRNPKGFMVYLGLPHWFDARPNTIEGKREVGTRLKLIYSVPDDVPEFADENTGENAKPIQVRHYNAMLLLHEDDDTDMDKIPLLRIVHDASREEPFPRQDPEYVSPCLHLTASPTLREMVRDLTSQVASVREQLANILARSGFDQRTLSGLQFEQVLRLRSLNRFTARLEALLDVGNGAGRIPPFIVYLELRDLLGELMALFPDRGGFETIPSYDHDNPYPCFRAVTAQIRNYLHGAVTPRHLKVDFVPTRESGVLAASLTDEHLTQATGYFLGIKTRQDPGSLTRLVEDSDQFKLMPASYLERAIRGIVLKEERFPPLELPADTGLFYYRLGLTESRRIWEQVQKEAQLVLRWNERGEIPDFQAALYMSLPPEDEEEQAGGRRSSRRPPPPESPAEPVHNWTPPPQTPAPMHVPQTPAPPVEQAPPPVQHTPPPAENAPPPAVPEPQAPPPEPPATGTESDPDSPHRGRGRDRGDRRRRRPPTP